MPEKTVGYDLLYVDPEEYSKLWTAVATAWPQAVLEDASDYIHDRRFSVEFKDDMLLRTDWWRWLLVEGAHGCSLNFTMSKIGPQETGEMKAFIVKMREEGILKGES